MSKQTEKHKTKSEEPENQETVDNVVTGTVFDDVFRTIAQKMPYLLLPLINEAFGTDYKEEQKFQQLRNEHYEKLGKIVTDSIIQIEDHLYHIECQSRRDGRMAIRMMQYDFAIAVEHSDIGEDGTIEMDFPESCVLYIRNHKDMPAHHDVRIRFHDGQSVTYRSSVIMAQDYTANSIFEKRLILLLPFHILRYESFLKTNGTDEKKLRRLLDDYNIIFTQLSDYCDDEEKSGLYTDMIALIKKIAEYIIPDDNPVKGGLNDIMGGKVLTLPSEIIRKEGYESGHKQGRQEYAKETVLLVYQQEGSLEKAAMYGRVTANQASAWLKEAGLMA